MSTQPPVTERKLGRHKALGLYWPTIKAIEIDSRLKNRARLEVLIHEFLHHRFPHWTEEFVDQEAIHMSKFLWKQGYRLPPK
jgi:hypothetical protein